MDIKQALDMAMQEELKAAEKYRTLARDAVDTETRLLFEQLAFRVLKYYSNFLYHLLPAHLNRIFSIQKYPAQKLPVIKSGY